MHNYTVLQELGLRNYRKFGQLHMEFDPRLTVIIGDNGAGKTSILDAAAIALGTLLHHIDNRRVLKSLPKLQGTDMRRERIDGIGTLTRYEPQPVRITASALDPLITVGNTTNPITWTRRRDKFAAAERISKQDAGQALEYSDILQRIINPSADERPMKLTSMDSSDSLLPLFAYYPANRLWVHQNKSKETPYDRSYGVLSGFFPESRAYGYIDCLNAGTNMALMMDWFAAMTYAELQLIQENGNNIDATPPELRIVRQAVGNCFSRLTASQKTDIRFDVTSRSLDYITTDSNGITTVTPFTNLSDGYRNVLSIIADIAYRMAVLNPGASNSLETPGVVLIDEVDLHLHPKWQERILGSLTAIFPRVQFIVTTHAPIVIQSAKDNQIRRIRKATQDDVHAGITGLTNPGDADYISYTPNPQDTGGHNVQSILEDYMDSSDQTPRIRELSNQFYRTLDTGDLDGASAILRQWTAFSGADDSEVIRAQVSLDMEQTERDDAHS